MPVETPVKTPVIAPPKTEPKIDPDRKLNPDRLCPEQKERIVREMP